MEKLFAQLADENHLTQIDEPGTFAERAAPYIAEINATHPFREGNGRCQLTLLSILMEHAGFHMDEERLQPDKFMEAMIASFHSNDKSLAKAIVDMVRP